MSSARMLVLAVRVFVWLVFFGGFGAMLFHGLSAIVFAYADMRYVQSCVFAVLLIASVIVYVALSFEIHKFLSRIRVEDEP